MNYITPQALKFQLDNFQKILIAKRRSSILTTIKTETTKLLQDLPRGVDKNQLLTLLEGIFGSKNFQDGKYKGGKEVVLETVQEFFGKENFKNGKFQGGWNEQQDTANLQKVFKPENFTNGEYTGGWNKTQDQQNLKQSLTNGEAKTLTSQLIEEKLGGSEKFQEGVYQSEAETINIVKKGLANEGPLLEVIHDIFGPDKFFPKEGGEGIPKGREGKVKDDRLIALQQAKYQDEIQATQGWLKFFKKHLIPSDKETIWRDKFGSNVEGAEDLYEDAKSKGQQILGEDFNDTEKRRIEKEGHTPDIIQTILKDIPIQRKKLAWDKFFRDREGDSRISKDWENNWRNSELSIGIAEKIYQNGWNNSPESLINKDKIIATYTTKTIVKSKEYEKSTKNINPLKHIAEEVDNAHDFIIQKIDLETDLNNFPTDEEIKGTYNEKQVPDTINYEELRNLRNSKIKSLFKQYFQGNSPSSLKDNEIELWRTSPTGLPNTGKDQRLAFDNGWITPREITETKTKYEGIENIAVLKVKKVDIDNEILKVKELVKQINAYRYLRDLDANQANIDKQFAELKTDLLPPNKAQEIKEAEQKQREKLFYYLTDPKDGGIEETTLKRLEKNLENKWEVPNYEPITIDMLNKLIAADKDVQDLQLLQDGVGHEDLTKSGWLEEKKGYVIPKKFTEPEEDLHRDQKGAFLLSFFYDKARDGNNRAFDPTDLDQENSFCRMGIDKVPKIEKDWKGKKTTVMVEKEVIGGNKGMAGHLAIGTGVGKTTKLINCLVSGGKRHIILVCPTVGLMESTFKHHTSWLQKWGCVYCGKEKSQTSMEFCRQGTFTKATDEEIAKGKADKEKQEIYISHGAYPVAKNDLAYWKDANTGQFGSKEEGQKGLSVMFFGNLLGTVARNLFEESGGVNSWSDNNEKQKVKEKLIPKEDTIVVFDEAHFNNPGYQALQFEMIKAGYKCLRMSATFPKTPFSATSTYHMTRMFSGKLNPKMPAGLMKIDNAEQAEIIEEMRGAKIGSIKFKTEKGLPIFIEVNLEERIRAGKTWYFSKSLQLNPEQLDALGINTKYTIYGEQYDENCEDVSYGQPYGSLGIVDGRREMGYTPDVDTVICSGITETKNLGNYFSYSDPVVGFTPISSLVQQMGRCARVKPGLAITLTKESMEMDLSDNVSAAMVKACFDGNTKQINEKDYKQIYDIDILRGALAYPSSKTFGKAPEEILMGLKVSEKQIKGKVKLDKLEWRQDTKEDENEAKAVPWYSSVKPDDELWGRYLGRDEKVPMKPEVALKTLKEMIANFIIQDGSFPQGLDMKKQEKMIGVVLGEKLGSDKGKEEIVRETRKVLNGLVKTKKDELGSKDFDGGKKCSKNPNTIRKLAGLYKLTDANVDYKRLKNDEGEEVWTLLMNTPIPAQA